MREDKKWKLCSAEVNLNQIRSNVVRTYNFIGETISNTTLHFVSLLLIWSRQHFANLLRGNQSDRAKSIVTCVI